MKTTQVTLRNIDEELKKLIDQNAQKRGQSINSYVVDVIKDSVGYKTKASQGWREFIGTMPDDGINQEVLDDFEKIDENMWK